MITNLITAEKTAYIFGLCSRRLYQAEWLDFYTLQWK